MLNQYEKLKDILREMFQMDQADLDFGIYRIMNAKRNEIEAFLDKELLPQVKEEFAKYRGKEISGKKDELENTVQRLKNDGADPEKSTKVLQLREEIAKYGDDESLSNDVFSHLSTFFRRYYDTGDFLSLRRYKKDTYAIPYEGEEVKLHWANADQYYIKTSEYLKDYSFKLPGTDKKAHFILIDASQEKDNIKTEAGKERKFKLSEDKPFRIEGKEVFIQFVYLTDKEKQDSLNKKTIETITSEFSKKLKDFPELFALAPTAKNPKRSILEKHLYSYTARFNFDFFIHKDLGRFLRRELDFYVKNEVLFVDDLDAQDEKKLKSVVAKVKVIKHIAQKVITFLATLEDFQKKLWLKKKLVVDCGYCVTLDRVPEALYSEIVKNKDQQEDWVKLFNINEIQKDLTKPGYSKPLTVEFLKANPYLVLDTKHFDEGFKVALLANFDNIDESTDGVIINSNNFHALNLLQEKYQEKVKCVYIDPPYNTDANAILYKNNYKHSSWLAFIATLLSISKKFENNKKGVHVIAIDSAEQHRLTELVSEIWLEKTITNISVIHNPGGTMGKNFSGTGEYAMFIHEDGERVIAQENRDDNPDIRELMNTAKGNTNNYLRSSGKTCFYPIYVKGSEIIGFGEICEDSFHPPRNVQRKDNIIEVYPIDSEGVERKWVLGRETVEQSKHQLFIKQDKKSDDVRIYRSKDEINYKTIWTDGKYSAKKYGTELVGDIIPLTNKIDPLYPKSIHLVEDCIHAASNNQVALFLDYFAGSGTTGHAVINLNRGDSKRRKYILIEMGDHFETVLKPRIQKVIYSKDWKDGKPVSREGISHIFKYIRLESYDDTLDNLTISRSEGQLKTIEKISGKAKEDYMLSYQLDIDTKTSDSIFNIDRFNDPFNYTLKIRKDDELLDQKIDLVETFNYLIGLYVEQTETIRGYKVVRGKLRTSEKTLVIWRNTKNKSNEDLDEFFKKQKYNTLDFEFDLIFVNGDNNLENLKVAEDKWKVRLIEEEFKKRMFEQAGV